MSRQDLDLLARGTAPFTGDLPLPAGTLHAQPATSPHPHARFIRVDVAAALAEPGVRAVLVAADIPGTNDVGTLGPEPLLADGLVECVGQPYALVVADSPGAAHRAVRLVTADWQPLPAVLDLDQAVESGKYLRPPRTVARGDVDAAWDRCTTVVAGAVRLGSADHVALETHCALTVPTECGLVVHSATQSPSVVQSRIARVLNLPANAIEVDVSRLGGAFGGKEDQATGWAALAALAAQHTGHPVRLELDRVDDLRLTGKRHPYVADFRLGLDGTGRFVAYEATLRQDAGCTTDLSPPVLERSLLHATNAYAIDNVRITAASYRTNLPSNTAFRGFGAPQGIFVIEAAIRSAARVLGVRPDELQARNLLRPGDALPYGQRVDRPRGRQAWDALGARRDPARVREEIDAHNGIDPRIRHGMAVVPVCFGIGFGPTQLNQAEALVHVYLDGTVSVSTGAVEMGQGVHSKIRAVVASTLGIDEEAVRVESTDTRRVANVSPTAASTGADLNGSAAREACRTILATLPPPQTGTWTERVGAAYAQRRTLSALAHYATPGLVGVDVTTGRGHPFRYHVYGAALVEASVDVLLGTRRIERVTVVHDCGDSLDEVTDRGQIEGAIVQGIGWMTTEEIRRDPRGGLLTDTLATYKVPDLPEAPPIEVHLLAGPNPVGLLGSKAVGEPPLVYGLGAFFALQDAIASWTPEAATAFTTPLGAERIFSLLHGHGDD